MLVPILLPTLLETFCRRKFISIPGWVAPLIFPHGFKMIQNLFSWLRGHVAKRCPQLDLTQGTYIWADGRK